MPAALLDALIAKAEALGYDTKKILRWDNPS